MPDEIEEAASIHVPANAFRVPKFPPSFPKEVLDVWHTLSPVEKYTLEQQSIRSQQMDWVLQKLSEGNEKMQYYDAKITAFDKLLTVFTAKKSVVALVVGSLVIPGFLLWLGTMIQKWLASGGKH